MRRCQPAALNGTHHDTVLAKLLLQLLHCLLHLLLCRHNTPAQTYAAALGNTLRWKGPLA